MNYIVSPSFVYLLSVMTKIQAISGALSILFGIVSVVFCGLAVASWYECKYYDKFSEENHDYRLFCLWKRILKIIIPFFVVCLVLTICIPDKEALISMKIASLATKENISLTADAIKELVDYIVDAISKIK